MDTRLARAASLALLATLSACASTARPSPPGVRLVPDATPVTGRWVGTYTCAQGLTGLTLTIEPVIMGQVEARFEFYPVAGNPTASGSYRMLGWYTTDGHLALVGVQWVRQPADYVMVGLSGRMVANGTRLEGTVPECAAPFSLQRR